MKRLLCTWSRDGIAYRIHRTGLRGMVLSARGPEGDFRVTYLDLAEGSVRDLRDHRSVSAIDAAYRATTGWRSTSPVERTQLAEMVLQRNARSLQGPAPR